MAYRHLQVAIRYPTQSFGLPTSDSARAPNGELSRSPSLSPSTSNTGFQLLDQDVAVARMTGQLGNHVRVDEPQAHRTLVPEELLVESVRLSHLS